MPLWLVTVALRATTNAISDGAVIPVPYKTRKEVRRRLKDNYKERKKEGANWHDDKKVILVLAAQAGALASLLTLATWDPTSSVGQQPQEVREEHVRLAMYYIANYVCPLKWEPRAAYCKDYSDTAARDSDDLKKLHELLQKLACSD